MNTPTPRLSRYRLLAEISSGGMGTVYLARDERAPGFEKLIALKRIHPHLAEDERFVTMFLDEARIASLVRHANVCGVEDFGVDSGTYFLTMEYLVGEPLSRVVKALAARAAADRDGTRNPRFFAIAARLLADACEGLHAAHELRDARGSALEIVHRDVSPPNLFVGYDGVIRILDFGIAKAAHRLAETTVDGIKGKFAYMAPEQIRRQTVDRRADVWSLGVVAFELLTFTRLYQRENELDTMHAILNGQVPLPSDVASDVPPELDAIVQRALARSPDERFQTARAMGRELARYLAESGMSAGLADVAEWMEQLFPEGGRTKRAFADEMYEQSKVAAATIADEPPRPRRSVASIAALAIGIALAAGGAVAIASSGLFAAREPPPESNAAEPSKVAAIAPPRAVEAPPDEEPPEPAPPLVITPEPPPVRRDRPRVARPETMREAPMEERVEPAPATDRPGTLQLVTTGTSATVRANGRVLGTTPLRVSMPSGRHALELRSEDGRVRRVNVTVEPGAVARVSVPFES